MEAFGSLNIPQLTLAEAMWLSVPHLISATVVAVLFVIFYYITSRILITALHKTKLESALQKILVRSVYRWLITIFAVITVLSQLGIDVSAALAGIGIAGVAVGFAAKESLANIMAGINIFVDRLYKNGDWIEVVGKYGQVKDITLRTTKIRTLDNIFINLPNSQITSNPVTNYSEEGMVRITSQVSISYLQPIEQAREVIIDAISELEGVLEDPAPQVVVDKLDESSVNLLVRIWVKEAGTEPKHRFTLNESIKNALDGANIPIPFPQRDVHLYTYNPKS
ncbi:mechanosensitive ion channel family protein [Candidatus Kaiserbacteria bacterium]|nr:mechanosensitive ion channel family protein [Candidatus Kaiserbacteria bacterium]